jgi:hypothetical protein
VIAYDDLKARHFEEWGVEVYPDPSRLIGFACRRDGELVAIGCCFVAEDDRWWASFGGRGEFPSGIHRKSLDLFAALRGADVKEVRAQLDPTIPRAREWLKRLGFEPADASEAEWILELCPPGP